jgi:hypothetical protein
MQKITQFIYAHYGLIQLARSNDHKKVGREFFYNYINIYHAEFLAQK